MKLACAAGSIALWGTGCRRARANNPSSTSSSRTLVVSSNLLKAHAAQVTSAWNAEHTVHLQIEGTSPNTSADVHEFTGATSQVLPLDSILRKSNFDQHTLVPGLIEPFLNASGQTLGLPVYPAQQQFYVNQRRLGAGTPTGRWTFSTLVHIAAAHAPKAGSSLGSIVGQGWAQDLRLWETFIVGLGGSFTDAHGAFNVQGILPALEQFVALARSAQWRPTMPLKPTWALATDGFTGPAANAVCGFDLPWPGQQLGLRPKWLVSGQAMDAAFPLLPAQPVIPSAGTQGLAVSATSVQPDTAVEFVVWLLQEPQQRMLAGWGVPPVIDTASLKQEWGKQQASGKYPQFTYGEDYDGPAVLGASTAAAMCTGQSLQKALVTMYETGDVSGQVKVLEQAVAAIQVSAKLRQVPSRSGLVNLTCPE